MKRLVVLFAIGAAALAVIGMLACGPGNDKPPLTPDGVDNPVDDAGPG